MESKVGSAVDNESPCSAASEAQVKNHAVKEGCFLLGSPTFVDIGNGRWRCVETGHDLPTKEKDSYARKKECRRALIDAAIAKNKPPLNTFQIHPLLKSKLVCSLTGDEINKSEEHIWKHINGRRFLHKLDIKEVEKVASPEKNKDKKDGKKSKLNAFSIHKDQNLEADGNGSLARESASENSDAEESNFWVPPIGERWDFDDGRDRWDLCNILDQEKEVDERDVAESVKLPECSKRMAIAMGPNGYITRNKKKKKT